MKTYTVYGQTEDGEIPVEERGVEECALQEMIDTLGEEGYIVSYKEE